MQPQAIARTVVGMARDGRFTEMEALFAPRLRAVVSAGTVRVAWLAETRRTGDVTGVGAPVCEPVDGGLVRVSVPVRGARGGLTVVMSVDGAGLLHGLRLAAPVAAWEPPPYAAPRRFVEHEVVVGDGPRAVPGTMTVPRGGGTGPGVVLLAGGGPFDRDGTAGANRPLKDIAWGLAGRGVTVLRFDKVTHAYPAVLHEPGFTMTDEYVPHAVAAVRLLRRVPGVERVFVLGHSMGGKVAPRVAAAEPSVAGLVLLAPEAQPLHRTAVRTARHLASLASPADPCEPCDPADAADPGVAAIERQAALVEDPGLSAATPAADLPLGLPPSYWLEERGYDPVATLAGLAVPVLILQGGRDYQVTVEDDLSRWRDGLAGRPGVAIRVFEADNHLFFRGTGRSTPAEYDAAQHVDVDVVDAVAAWLGPRGRIAARLLSRVMRRPRRRHV